MSRAGVTLYPKNALGVVCHRSVTRELLATRDKKEGLILSTDHFLHFYTSLALDKGHQTINRKQELHLSKVVYTPLKQILVT